MGSGYKAIFTALAASMLLLASCVDFNSGKHVINRYYLRNDESGKYLAYQMNDDGDYLEIVHLNSYGTNEIGFDDNYIIIKTDRYHYVIVPVYKEYTYWPEKGILSWLNPAEFDRQKKKLGIKTRFTIRW